jgi:hypothetical protein
MDELTVVVETNKSGLAAKICNGMGLPEILVSARNDQDL